MAAAGAGLAPAAGQDHCQRPGRLRPGQDPLGQTDLPAPSDQLRAEPHEQAKQHPGGAGRNSRPQSGRHQRPPLPGSERPGRQGYKANRRPEGMRQRAAAPGRLRVRRDQHRGDTAGHQDEPPGQGRRPQCQPRQDMAGSHPRQRERHHPPAGSALRREGADRIGYRVEGTRLQPGSHRPAACQ